MTPEQQRAVAAAQARMKNGGGQQETSSSEPPILFTTKDGGRIYRGADGQPGYVSDGFATRDQDTIAKLMEGATPSRATDWQPVVDPGNAAISGARGAFQGATFGAGDEIVAGVTSVLSGRPYEQELKAERRRLELGREQHPVSTYGGEVTGGLATALTGIGAVGQAATRTGQIARSVGMGALEGGIYGFNAGDSGTKERVLNGLEGSAYGAAAGGASMPVGAALSRIGRSGKSVFQTLIRPGQTQRAQNALGTALGRSGEDVAAALRQAATEGQPEYAVADALGRPGQRMLSGVTRSTPEIAQEIQDTLTSRQSGQAGRVGSFIADAFDAPDSAMATREVMEQARGTAANANYGAARKNADPVDIRSALNIIDERIGGMQGSGVRGDGIDARFAAFRNRLAAANPEKSTVGATNTVPNGTDAAPTAVELSDFNRVLGVKQDIQDTIGAALRAGRNNEARELGKLVNALDEALETSSSGYRQANDAFASASREIDQISPGQRAAGPRSRAEDTIAKFNGLTNAEKAAFRTGYAEPHIAKISAGVEGANTARPFTSQKFQQEAGAMAKDPALLSRRLERENQMFSTGNTVLGGSRTADNLIDMEDSSRFGPGALTLLLQGRIGDGFIQAAGPTLNRLQGRSPAVRQEMGQMLTKTGDEGASLIQQLLMNKQREQAAKQLMIDRLTATGGVGAGMSQN